MAQKTIYGDGHIRERKDGIFEYIVRIDDLPNPKKSFYGKTPKEAKKKYRAFIENQKIATTKTSTFGEWISEWLKTYKSPPNVAPGTYNEYDIIVNQMIVPELGHIRLAHLKPAQIKNFMNKVEKGDVGKKKKIKDKDEKSGNVKDNYGYSLSRQRKTICLIKESLDEAVENRLIISNPARSIKLPKKPETNIKIYSSDEIETILKFADTHPFGPYVKILLFSGLRKGEVLALTWRNVDLNTKMLKIKQSVSWAEDGYQITPGTKNGKSRIIPINDELINTFKKIPKNGYYVVSDSSGQPYTVDKFNCGYRRFMNDIKKTKDGENIEYLSPHKLRHCFGSYMISSGADIVSVQKIMGHESVTTTEIYLHEDISNMRTGIDKLKF